MPCDVCMDVREDILDHVFRYAMQGNFILASGEQSDLYIDVKSALLDTGAGGLIDFAIELVFMIYGYDFPEMYVIGRGYGGAILVSMMIAQARVYNTLRGAIVRQGTKGHGLGDAIIGRGLRGAKVVIVEDVITTGSSIGETVRAVDAAGGVAIGAVAIVDRTQGKDLPRVLEGLQLECCVTERAIRAKFASCVAGK